MSTSALIAALLLAVIVCVCALVSVHDDEQSLDYFNRFVAGDR